MTPQIIIISIVIALIIITGIIINNKIVVKKNRVAQAYGSIEVYLKKRFDLIPNLVATLNKYLEHEKESHTTITSLRTQVASAQSQQEKITASNELTKLVAGLNLTVENYPDLKADKQFSMLQYELSDIEDQISAARRAYNAVVTSYNNTIEMFPASIIASIRKDMTATLLEIPKAEQKEVNIETLLNN